MIIADEMMIEWSGLGDCDIIVVTFVNKSGMKVNMCMC